MILDATDKTIELILGAAATANAMPVTVDYVDMTTTTTLSGSLDSASNGTTLVTIVAAPAASTQRKINLITVYNADTASKAVTIRLNNNTTLRNIVVVTLQVGDTLAYTDTRGWYVIGANGATKEGQAIAAEITFTPAGNVSATDLQAAVVELDAEKAALSQLHGRNVIKNPAGEVYQIAVAATADDTYFADCWYALTQTGTVLPSVLASPEDGYNVGTRLTQSQATAQRFGYAQIIEGKDCKYLRGGSGTLVPRIRVSASQAVRYAILGWTGTEDTVTSDVVLDWTSASYTAGGFFLAASVSVLGVGAVTPSANTWTSLTALTASMGSSFNNVVVMVWIEAVAAQNFTLDFDFHKLEQGTFATTFERLYYEAELARCQRYYEIGSGHFYGSLAAGDAVSCLHSMKVKKRATPTLGTVTSGSEANFTYTNTTVDAAGDVIFYGSATATGTTEIMRSVPILARL